MQMLTVLGLGGAAGASYAKTVGPTELPQTVALAHSLVGAAAALTSIGVYMDSAFLATAAEAASAAAVRERRRRRNKLMHICQSAFVDPRAFADTE